jgi:hypothetical protein
MNPLNASEIGATGRFACGLGRGLSIVLPHTDLALTDMAVRFCGGLELRITLLAVRVVPFPEPVDPSRGYPGFDGLIQIAERAGVPLTIHIAYARDWEAACDQALPENSLILIAARRHWLATREERLADRLKRAGHTVTMLVV